MMFGTLALTCGFGSSDRLAGAYGTAVSTTMLLTTGLLYDAMRKIWRWPAAVATVAGGVFLAVDLAFFGANLLKLREGGAIPLVLGALIFAVMTTWRHGMDAVHRRQAEDEQSAEEFLGLLRDGRIPRVPGTAVFLSHGTAIPALMVRHVSQMKALQRTAVILRVSFDAVPRVAVTDRATVDHIADGLWHVTCRFGFVEIPNLVQALIWAKEHGCPLTLDDAVYFAARDEVVRSKTRPRLPAWQRLLFGFMYRNAVRTPDRFDLPPATFLEVSRQVRL